MTSRAIVVLSGGQDSTTALYWARPQYDELHALTFDYGQRHEVEIAAAQTIAAMAGVTSHEIIMLGRILHGASPLTDPAADLETYNDFATMDSIIGNRVELTFVPMRNLMFLTIAANRAACLGADAIIIGICEADNANYPDCRASFAEHTEGVINLALGNHWGLGNDWIRVVTPLINSSKADTVRLAASLPGCLDALAYSHTCYAGRRPPCGVCHACVLRAHGFAEAGIGDPLILATMAHA